MYINAHTVVCMYRGINKAHTEYDNRVHQCMYASLLMYRGVRFGCITVEGGPWMCRIVPH